MLRNQWLPINKKDYPCPAPPLMDFSMGSPPNSKKPACLWKSIRMYVSNECTHTHTYIYICMYIYKCIPDNAMHPSFFPTFFCGSHFWLVFFTFVVANGCHYCHALMRTQIDVVSLFASRVIGYRDLLMPVLNLAVVFFSP